MLFFHLMFAFIRLMLALILFIGSSRVAEGDLQLAIRLGLKGSGGYGYFGVAKDLLSISLAVLPPYHVKHFVAATIVHVSSLSLDAQVRGAITAMPSTRIATAQTPLCLSTWDQPI